MRNVLIATIMVLALLVGGSTASGRNNGQWSNHDPWWQAQLVPGGPAKGSSCCSQADGVRAQEEIRSGGTYWVTFSMCDYVTPSNCTVVPWMPVPDDAVLTEPNKQGVPVVWYYVENGIVKIRCFAVGPKA